MKDLYKLAVAFEKASQVSSGSYYNPAKPSDEKVMSLQTCLMNLGFPLQKGADGIMGPETNKAINDFKAKYKLTNASPDIVAARIHAEADKLLGGRTDESTQLSFKVNQPAPANSGELDKTKALRDASKLSPQKQLSVKDLADSSMYAVPESGNFTPLK